jgi:gas vesicle protein
MSRRDAITVIVGAMASLLVADSESRVVEAKMS